MKSTTSSLIGMLILMALVAGVWMLTSIKETSPEDALSVSQSKRESPATSAAETTTLEAPPALERVEATPEMHEASRISNMLRDDLEQELRNTKAELERARFELLSIEGENSHLAAESAPSWSASKVIGPPDAEPTRDDQNAWAPAQANAAGLQWVEVTYRTAMRADSIHIYEVCTPGAVVSVSGYDTRGKRHLLWSGVDPMTAPGAFALNVPRTKFKVKRLRITINPMIKKGWNEIDAVELIGPDGRAWASSATASSHFGAMQNTAVNSVFSSFKLVQPVTGR
ncbi:MAG: hypothetical protein ACI841_003261 [Planctomycetota bacterium]|jgi:hypothetical protein